MKKLLWLIILALTLSIVMAASITSAGGLCDFTKSGMIFMEKTEKGEESTYKLVDLTALMRIKDYSHYVPEANEYVFEGLLVLPEDFRDSREPHEKVINTLKKYGENGQISLPAFRIIKNGETVGFKILTSTIIITVKNGLSEEMLQKLVEKITSGCTIEKIGERNFEINLSLKSNLNPFEMTTELSKCAEIKSCGPAFIECPLQKNLPPIEEEPEGWPFDF